MSKPGYFHELIFQELYAAHWGREYDRKIMDAIFLVDQAEHFLNIDWETVEADVKAGRLNPSWGDKNGAIQDLENARAALESVRRGLEAAHGSREAAKILEKHHARFEEWENSQIQADPELALIVSLAEWLSQALGRVPTNRETGELIDSLKAMAKIHDPETSPERARSLLESELTRPVFTAVKLKAARRPHEDQRKWREIYFTNLSEVSERIWAEKLFVGGSALNISKILARKGAHLALASGQKASSPIVGQIHTAIRPDHRSDQGI